MFLLNDRLIKEYGRQNRLVINPWSDDDLGNTFYYFNLGESIELFDRTRMDFTPYFIDPDRPKPVELPARGYARITSRESFRCSETVLCIFGQVSLLAKSGLRLNHSPFIDPTFEGVLKMGIENLLDTPQPLNYGMRIGKATFYDVTDTYPITKLVHTSTGERVIRRQSPTEGS